MRCLSVLGGSLGLPPACHGGALHPAKVLALFAMALRHQQLPETVSVNRPLNGHTLGA